MSFDPDRFLAETSPKEFDPDAFLRDTEEKSVGGFARNLGGDVKDTVLGLGHLVKNLATHPIDTTVGTVKGLPHALIEEGKRIGAGELLTGHPINALEKFGDAAYEKPLTTGLDVLPAVGAAGKLANFGRAGKTGKLAEMATQAERAGASVADDLVKMQPDKVGKSATLEAAEQFAKEQVDAPRPFEAPSNTVKGNTVLKEAPEPRKTPIEFEAIGGEEAKTPPPGGSTPPKDPLKDVYDYIAKKYGKASETEGVASNLGRTLEQKARGMRLKEIGGTPGQIRTLRDRFGEQTINDLADLAEEKGITKGFFNQQMGDKIKELSKSSGESIGAVRDIAKGRGAVHNPDELIAAIREKLDPVYMKGTGSSQRSAYLKALEDIKRSKPDVVSLAETISAKNKYISKNKLTQPLGAARDVMNQAARLNDELIGKFLNPEEAALYAESLKDFSASKVFDKMYGYTFGRDMAGRTGPSGPINFLKDVGGRKVMEKVFDTVGKRLQKDPNFLKSPSKLSAEVLDAMDQSLDEIIEQMGGGGAAPGMWEGGVVDPQNQMAGYLQSKYGSQAPKDPIYERVLTDPEMARWASEFETAAARGPQAVTSTHFVLMQKDPEYNALYTKRQSD